MERNIDINELKSTMFKILYEKYKSQLYISILDSNLLINEILMRRGTPVVIPEAPIWMISGGEAINYYSSDVNKTSTKDLDCKLLFTGEYSIGVDFFDRLPIEIKGMKQELVKTYKILFTSSGIDITTKNNRDLLQMLFDRYDPIFTAYIDSYDAIVRNNLEIGMKSQREILWNMLNTNYANGDAKELIAYSGWPIRPTVSVSIDDLYGPKMLTEETGGWYQNNITGLIDEDTKAPRSYRGRFKIFSFKRPFIATGDTRLNFPYSQPRESTLTLEYLRGIKEKLNSFYSSPVEERRKIFDRYYALIYMMRLQGKLTALCNCILLIPESGNSIMIHEGVLDLFVDYHCDSLPMGRNIYEGRNSNGLIPSIIKNITYCGKESIIKIPTLNYLIYDQTRMLYFSLRKQNTSDDWWDDSGPTQWRVMPDYEAEEKKSKYFPKLKRMLQSYIDVIDIVQQSYDSDEANRNVIIKTLQDCAPHSECTPSHFLSFIFESITNNKLWDPSKDICVIPSGLGAKHLRKQSKRKKVKRKRISKRKTI